MSLSIKAEIRKCARIRTLSEELSQSQQAGFIYLILCTVSGVAAGLQNTG